MKKLLLLALCALFACNADARTLYVDAKRPNNNGSGLSRAKAKKTIQAAVNVAQAGDVILVYPGKYTPIKTQNRKIAVKSVKGASKTAIVKTTQAAGTPLAQLGKTYSYVTSEPGNYSKRVTINSAPLTKGTATALKGFLLDGNGKRGHGMIGVSGGTVSACTIRNVCGDHNCGTRGGTSIPVVAPWTGTAVARNAKLTACKIENNTWSDWAMLSFCTLDRCKIAGNTVDSSTDNEYRNGYLDSGWHLVSDCTISNCLLAKNKTKSGYPGLVSACTLVNCTMADNLVLAAKDASGAWLGTAGPRFSSWSKWYNCILRNNKGRVDVVSGGEWVDDYDEDGECIGGHFVERTTVKGTAKIHNVDSGNAYKTTNKTNKNPKFGSGYKPAAGSYCIDRGVLSEKLKKLVGTKDLAGRKRIRGKAIDLGCYEY